MAGSSDIRITLYWAKPSLHRAFALQDLLFTICIVTKLGKTSVPTSQTRARRPRTDRIWVPDRTGRIPGPGIPGRAYRTSSPESIYPVSRGYRNSVCFRFLEEGAFHLGFVSLPLITSDVASRGYLQSRYSVAPFGSLRCCLIHR